MSKKINDEIAITAGEFREIVAKSGWDLEADLAAQGVDAIATVARLRKLREEARSRFAQQLSRESGAIKGMSVALPRFDEAVAAGRPADIEGHAPAERMAT